MYLLLSCVVFVLWYMLFRYKRRRLYQLADLIPGQSENVPFLGVLKYSFNAVDILPSKIEEISRQSFSTGGIQGIWAGPLFIVGLTNPTDIEFISKSCLEKDQLLVKSLNSVLGNAGIFAPVSIWARRRKVLTSAFSPKVINSLLDIFKRRSRNLADSLEQYVDCGLFDIWPYVNNFTLGSVSETSLGIKNINQLEKEMNVHFLETVAELLKLVTYRILHIWLWPDWIYKCSSQYYYFSKYYNVLVNLTNNIIKKKRNDLQNIDMNTYENQKIFGQGDDKVDSFLDHLILLSKRQNGFTDTELREEISTFLLAGTDTSAVAICNTLLLLVKYPKVQEKVYEELVSVFENADDTLYKDVLNELKYMDIVLKESLRLFPPTPIVVRKTHGETKLPSGVILPADTAVIISIWGAHHDPNYWGPDADCFDPDRFLPGRTSGLFIPFSTGPRNCVGYRYAMMTAKSALSTILRRFRVVGAQETGPVPKIKCNFSIMLRAAEGYHMKLEKR